ncbi:MAG TPA: hypothetical protein VHN14_17455 [Kofleriaceae bacterium]|jgi:hypothetical protein|nr:hypothetical protein [Kofleriaceae bacterium]
MTSIPRWTISTLGLALAACGDNRGAPDALVDAAAGPRAVIVAGDFNDSHPGVLSTLDPAARTVMTNVGPALAVGGNPILRHFGHELFIINSNGGNNITILDDQMLRLKEQLGTGAGSNPQDVAVVGDKLYVPTLGTSGVTVLTRGSTVTHQIDLSADDPDGKPDCNSVYLVGTLLYVSCGLLDGFPPTRLGKVYVVDTATDTVKPELTMTLVHKNPFTLFEQIPANAPHGGDLLIATSEDFAAPGCIERIATGVMPSAAGCMVDSAKLGGYVTRIDFEIDNGLAMVWSAVSIPTTPPAAPRADLRGYDLMTDALWSAPINPTSEVIGEVVHCPGGQVVVVDTTMNASGLRVYEDAAETTTAVIPVGIAVTFSPHGLVCY